MIPSLCSAEWGQDFRPEYLQLGMFKDFVAGWVKQQLPSVPIMALTATATKSVQREIMTALKLDNTAKVGTPAKGMANYVNLPIFTGQQTVWFHRSTRYCTAHWRCET